MMGTKSQEVLAKIDISYHSKRFWSKVDVRGPDDCWEWQGAKQQRRGHHNDTGKFGIKFEGKTFCFVSSRFAWASENGLIPDGLFVCHRCDNPMCCNPAHLFLGTPKDNTQDMVQKDRHNHHGEGNSQSRFKAIDIQEMRYMAKRGIPRSKIQMAFNVTQSALSNIINRKSWFRIPDFDLPIV